MRFDNRPPRADNPHPAAEQPDHVDSAMAVASALSHLFTHASEAELAFMQACIAQGDAPTAARVAHGILGAIAFEAQPRPPAADPQADAARSTAPVLPEPPLTARELKVLWMIARGCTNQQIADTTYRSINTIESHVKNVYRKLSVKSRTQAIREATQKGLLSWPAEGGDGVSVAVVEAGVGGGRTC